MAHYTDSRAHRSRLVRDLLRDRILAGAYADRVLPSEDQLVAEFEVGRNVVREALSYLVAERLVQRSQGIGTRPTSHVVVHELNSLRAIAEEGDTPGVGTITYRHLTWQVLPAIAPVARQLGVDVGDDVVLWERLTLGPEPMVLWTSYLPADLGLPEPEPLTPGSGGGTFAYLESHGAAIGHAQVRTGASQADPAVAALLEIPPGSPVMVQHRSTLSPQGRVIEIATGYYRHDRIYLRHDIGRTRDRGDRVDPVAPVAPVNRTAPTA